MSGEWADPWDELRARDAPARGWVEEAIAAVERLQGREYVPGSICDIRLAKKED